MAKIIKFILKCPDCGKDKHLINHHIITKQLCLYLINIGKYEKGTIMNLRNQLKVRICKDCEKKFHKK